MILEGNLVNLFTKEIYPAKIIIKNDKITEIKELKKKFKNFLLPGFIDAHIHIESSLLCPSRFAEVVIPHGTTTVITDPHEIANVLGIKGIEYMRKDSLNVPLRFFFTVPSCVPATMYETSGAKLGVKEIEKLIQENWTVGLGEVMNFTGVINEDMELLEKMNIAKKYKKRIDGHAPLLSGVDLCKYVSFGIDTEHECTSIEEAREKARLGMKIMIREGSATKNMKSLIEISKKAECFFVCDDKHPEDLRKGHLDTFLRKAISLGVDPIKAIKMITINPATHYNLNVGAITPGRKADIVIVNDLKKFDVKKVIINGKLAAIDGKPQFSVKPKKLDYNFKNKKKNSDDFKIYWEENGNVEVRVINIVKDQIITNSGTAVLKVENNNIIPDVKNDILKIAVVERYGGEGIGKGFIHGFSLKRGAIASSVSHDSHNIITVGTNNKDMERAVNLVSKKGGFTVVSDKVITLELPIAGLLTTDNIDQVCMKMENLNNSINGLGCNLKSPFMTLSFMTLLVIPELKISDRGLFDSKIFKFIDVVKQQL